MSESEGGIWLDHTNVAVDSTNDCDIVGPTVVEPNPDPLPPVIASKGYHYNHCKDPLAIELDSDPSPPVIALRGYCYNHHKDHFAPF